MRHIISRVWFKTSSRLVQTDSQCLHCQAIHPTTIPIEKLWKKIKEGYTHCHYFKLFDDLVETVDAALAAVASKAKKVVKPLYAKYEKLADAA